MAVPPMHLFAGSLAPSRTPNMGGHSGVIPGFPTEVSMPTP